MNSLSTANRRDREAKRSTRQSTPAFPARRFYALAAASAAVAFAVRLCAIGAQALSLDEAFSWYVSTSPAWFHSILADNNPPLYYLILHAWTFIAGTSETALRLPAAVAGTLFVCLVIWAGVMIFNRHVALWAGLAAALAPIQIFYSQQARVYPLLDSLLVLTWILVWRAIQTNQWSRWALASAVAAIALYSHYLAIIALLPTAMLLWVLPKPERLFRYAVSSVASLALFVPWAWWSFVAVQHPAVGTSWIENAWAETSKLLAIPESLEMFAIGSDARFHPLWMGQFAEVHFPEVLRLLALLTLVFLAIVLFRSKGERDLGIPDLGARRLWILAALIAPLLALWLISWVKPIYVVGRYDILAYPAFPLLVGLALAKLQRSSGWQLAALTAAAFLIPALVKMQLYYSVVDARQAGHMARLLGDEVRNGDVVVFTGLRGLPVLYELSRAGYAWEGGYCSNTDRSRRFYCRMYPRISEKTPAATNTERLLGSTESAKAELGDFLPRLDSRTGTLWLVLYGRSDGGTLQVPQADQLLLRELAGAGFEKVPDKRNLDLLFLKYRPREQAPLHE